ncbi:MAG: penicillin acylase family protein [Candidatus Hodarchaeales archaeon]|jgi:penicillin amidase
MFQSQKNTLYKVLLASFFSFTLIIALFTPLGMIPPLGSFLLPGNGIWRVPQEVPEFEEYSYPGLSDEVKVFRDEWGIPHIYGSDLGDIVFALGYCHAQDRWFEMDMARRSVRGLLSEILGPDLLEQDKFNLLKLGEYWANETLKVLATSADSDIKEMYKDFELYTAGVNLYLSEHSETKPVEYYLLDADIRPWEMLDSMCLVKYLSEYFTWNYHDMDRFNVANALGIDAYTELYGFPFPYQIPVTPNYGQYDDISHPSGTSISEEVNSISTTAELRVTQVVDSFLKNLERFPQEKERLERDAEVIGRTVFGSNNWAVSGSKTSTGKPMLATDMHAGWPLPGIWYEAHLVDISPDSDFNIYGLCFPGIPFPISGNTRYVAWAETIAMFDMIDWYYYDVVDDSHYLYKGQSTEYETLEVTIPVKGRSPETFIIKSTVHGPVFTDLVPTPEEFSDLAIACKWVAQNVTRDFLAIWGYLYAKNAQEFDEASQYFEMLPLNIVYADIYDNIGIRPNGKVPIRNDTGIPSWNAGAGSMMYNGSAGEGEWIGYVPFEDLPHEENPLQGYLCSANQVIAGPDFTNIETINQAGTADGYRARRLNYLLSSDDQITMEDMKNFQLDVYSVRAGNFTPYFLSVLNSIPSPTSLQQTIAAELSSWDFIMDKDQVAPTIFNIWFEAYHSATFDDEKKEYNLPRSPSWPVLEKLTKENATSRWFNNLTTTTVETRDDIILQSLNTALDALVRYFGTDDISKWIWGEIHQLLFWHISGLLPFDAGPFPGDGTGVTVNPSGTSNFRNGNVRKQSAGGGASERMIIDFSNFSNSLSVIPSGQRGISTSKHYTDQLEELFLNGEYHYTHFDLDTPEKIMQGIDVESRIVFTKGGA